MIVLRQQRICGHTRHLALHPAQLAFLPMLLLYDAQFLISLFGRLVHPLSAMFDMNPRGALRHDHHRDDQHNKIDHIGTDPAEIRADQPREQTAEKSAAVSLLISVGIGCGR